MSERKNSAPHHLLWSQADRRLYREHHSYGHWTPNLGTTARAGIIAEHAIGDCPPRAESSRQSGGVVEGTANCCRGSRNSCGKRWSNLVDREWLAETLRKTIIGVSTVDGVPADWTRAIENDGPGIRNR